MSAKQAQARYEVFHRGERVGTVSAVGGLDRVLRETEAVERGEFIDGWSDLVLDDADVPGLHWLAAWWKTMGETRDLVLHDTKFDRAVRVKRAFITKGGTGSCFVVAHSGIEKTSGSGVHG